MGLPGVISSQKTYSSSKVEQKWKEEFKVHVFFSQGKNLFCGVLTAYFGKENFSVKKETDKEHCILSFDVSVNDSEYILINLYNAISKKDKLMHLVTCLYFWYIDNWYIDILINR